ncbi:MAG: phasin family protein [Acetobacteraceae bacterium]|nr:phasin family protein [Acetobacteraceae bacterium]
MADNKQENRINTQVGEAARQGAEAIEQGGRAGSEAVRRGAEVGSEAARRGAQAGTEAVRRLSEATTEIVRRNAQAVAESQRQLVQDATEQFQEVSRKVAQAVRGTTEDVRTLFVLPNAARGGLEEVQQSVTGLVEGLVNTNLRATQELVRLVNPSPIVELQQRFVREYLDAVLEGSATMVRAVRRTADQTLGPIEEQIERRRQGNRGGQGYQAAAE